MPPQVRAADFLPAVLAEARNGLEEVAAGGEDGEKAAGRDQDRQDSRDEDSRGKPEGDCGYALRDAGV
jgi:hypothetical protein